MGEEGLLCLQCNQGQGYQWCDLRFSNLTLYHGKKKNKQVWQPCLQCNGGQVEDRRGPDDQPGEQQVRSERAGAVRSPGPGQAMVGFLYS